MSTTSVVVLVAFMVVALFGFLGWVAIVHRKGPVVIEGETRDGDQVRLSVGEEDCEDEEVLISSE